MKAVGDYLVYKNGNVCTKDRHVYINPECTGPDARLMLPIEIGGTSDLAVIVARVFGVIPAALKNTTLPDSMYIYHIDGNPFNCAAQNLVLREKTENDEVWKRYKDTEYFVSNLGHVASARTKSLKKITVQRGQFISTVCTTKLRITDGETVKYKLFTLPRLVVETFIDEDLGPNKQVAHLDGDPQNNRLSNLKLFETGQGRGTRSMCRHGQRGRMIALDGKIFVSIQCLGDYLTENYGGTHGAWVAEVYKYRRGQRTSRTVFLQKHGIKIGKRGEQNDYQTSSVLADPSV